MKKKQFHAIIYQNDTGEILNDYSQNDLANLAVKREATKKFFESKEENALITKNLGERILVYQNILKMSSKTFTNMELKVFNLLLGLADYENKITMPQSELAEELKTSIPNISKAARGLHRMSVIEIKKKNNINSYFINPMTAWKGKFDKHKQAISSINIRKKEK